MEHPLEMWDEKKSITKCEENGESRSVFVDDGVGMMCANMFFVRVHTTPIDADSEKAKELEISEAKWNSSGYQLKN